MRISVWKITGSLLLLALLALGLWIYSQTEFVEVTIFDGFKGAAARNPLLAAGRLAERYGASARYVTAYTKPPASDGTLIFSAPRWWLTAEQNSALLDWAKKGGHLIVAPQTARSRGKLPTRLKKENASSDPLLALLGVHATPEPDDKKLSNPVVDLSNKLNNMEPKPQTIQLPDGTHLKALFNPKFHLRDLGKSSDWQISDSGADVRLRKDKSNYGLSFALDKGRVTVLANLDFLDNAQIGKLHHAALFVWLASLEKGRDIWLVHGKDAPSLWRWLIDHAGTVLIAAAALLSVWLWMISRRFGAPLPARSAERRSIAEHVAASARYLWRSNQGQALYQTLCDDFYKRAFLRHPQWSRLPFQELTQQIALFAHETGIPQLSGLTAQSIEDLLEARRARDEKQFAAHSHLLDMIRNTL